MKFSEQWLREWVNPSVDTEQLAARLTMAGLEVDAIDPVAGEFSGVVVAEIVAAEPHPDAEKLQVCRVNNGTEEVQIVCGAKNARPGIKVPLATLGAILPGNFKIKKAKLRGVESFGMLCAEEELGLAEKSDGLMELPLSAPLGEDIRQLLNLDDATIELGLTPNRADCLSVRGIAREAAVLSDLSFTEPANGEVQATISDVLPITVQAPSDCPRYLGRVIKNVDVSAPSPLWLQEKLRRCGLRSIDAVVDVTNFILLELGQPMHAFDLDKIQGGVVVRHANAKESLSLLDGQTIEVNEGALLIADEQQPLALAGIMGGEPSSVTTNTAHLFLEAAFFTPEKIAGRARSYGLHTDSSHRFERGVDFELPRRAIERATALIVEICGGDVGPISEAEGELPAREPIVLRESRIEKLLGMALSGDEVVSILTGLGMLVTEVDGGWRVIAPSWRFDIGIEVDLLEELARVYGYNRLPVTPLHDTLTIRPAPESLRGMPLIRQQLVARGYQEAVTYSFIDPAMHEAMSEGEAGVELLNPISADMSIMRTTLLPGLLKTAMHNAKRQQSRIRLFESGLRFLKSEDGVKQIPTVAGLITGRREPENWTENGELVDFYDLKADLESLLSVSTADISFSAGKYSALHPGQTADIYCNDICVGRIGALHPSLQAEWDFVNPVYLFEIDQQPLLDQRVPEFMELSRFPEVRRDLALIVDKELAAAELLAVVKKTAGEMLSDLKLFDIYQGKGIDPERKSLALGLTFRHSSRTLNEEEVSQSVDAVVLALKEAFGASLRN
ncbi:Phenylalanine--tRNA ligase beta subunit [Zhongshania aliphaticivorans]|uniref:Phenylalanine--tRNA ligase beta subunit n=1 Tax=Zhongshania aliphaticivorans TaxID=1470434 RepID=A0A5S9N9Z6_9GAMM|nr:phenylalanine--tRNA ligase subunit beta [Zhongshania aliphaticivorans]CAA0086911.1 Phenylalanine--tRNA ligase beta subunit [Zhongshania aliphaticivorans]